VTCRESIPQFGLETLLGERAVEIMAPEILEEHVVAHGPVERLAAFAKIPSMATASRVIDSWDGLDRTARAWSPEGAPAYEIFATKGQLRTLYDAGCTIVLESVERFVPALRPLCRALERELGIATGRVNVEIFCARRGGHGRPHFDPSFTFNCQISGTKTWRLQNHPAVQHPTFGMFLGRQPLCSPDCHDCAGLPTEIVGGDTVVAEPGTVVFVPPGILHETRADGETYAIAFAVEEVDSVAARVIAAARTRLYRQRAIRAARFGPQFQDVASEARAASELLRELASEVEHWDWQAEAHFALKQGLNLEVLDATHVELSATRASKRLTLDETAVAVLGLSADRQQFSLRELAAALPSLDATLLEESVRQFVNIGILEPLG
jgi:hypothetical protein